MNINELIAQAHETALKKGWWDDDPPTMSKLMLIVTEVAEAAEELRDGVAEANGYDVINYEHVSGAKPEGFSTELADILIRVADLCGRYNIDLDRALEVKMAYNRTRPYRHGGKAA
ncbi:hypothetical protein LCGC14_1164920 [marine sediment metagenome]|uniref:NTP pyrophosphohydrolase MazG putative catalytic core domain-containing protein n=1 Tax=marine sediment metagenome TaxID=412755 RepID=A0A0F9LRM8_9ZZZZ